MRYGNDLLYDVKHEATKLIGDIRMWVLCFILYEILPYNY